MSDRSPFGLFLFPILSLVIMIFILIDENTTTAVAWQTLSFLSKLANSLKSHRAWREGGVRGREGSVRGREGGVSRGEGSVSGREERQNAPKHQIFFLTTRFYIILGRSISNPRYLPGKGLPACMLTHAATFAPLWSVHSKSDSYILHYREAISNLKRNCQSLQSP